MLEKAAALILKGLAVCLRKSGPLRNEITNTPDFWSLMQSLHDNQEVAGSVFGLLENIAAGQPPAVTADNYEPTVGLLNAFATSGSVGAVTEQKRDKDARRQKPVKPIKPRLVIAPKLKIRRTKALQRKPYSESRLQGGDYGISADEPGSKSNQAISSRKKRRYAR